MHSQKELRKILANKIARIEKEDRNEQKYLSHYIFICPLIPGRVVVVLVEGAAHEEEGQVVEGPAPDHPAEGSQVPVNQPTAPAWVI